VTWQAASVLVLAAVIVAGFAWYERDKPPARVLALVATLAALAVVGRLAFAAIPNVKPTTDIVLFAGYALGAVPGFAVGAITALVSNVFFSQGPWTPWQMVGWGAAGVAGAMLARVLRGREPGRLLLAAVCGIAGLVFGAWMDLYQLTLAAHQDLDTYLALSASSLPYNVAHATGNVVFCLLIGPVFIRALRRYRRRLEVRWAAPAAAGAALLVLLLALPAAAGAATPADRAERWLLRAQNADGGFGAVPDQSSGELFSGWAGLGLAAADHNPRDLRRRGGRSLASYLQRNAGAVRDIGEIERTVLLLRAAGMSPRRFGGGDLVAAIRARRRADGSISGYVSYTVFGVLALRAAGVSAGGETVRWLLSAQNDDGGFGLAPSSPSDGDMTGAALQALAVVGRARSARARRAVEWLSASQNEDGGFGQFPGRSSNAQSTAYAVQGLVAGGAGKAVVSRALAYLRGLQRRDGSVAYSSTSGQTPVWVTAQALLAFERAPLPIAAVPREERPRSAAGDTPASSGGSAAGGGGDGSGAAGRDVGGGAAAGSGTAAAAPAAQAPAASTVTPAAGAKRAAERTSPGAAERASRGAGVPAEEDGVAPGPALTDSATAAAENAGDDGVPVGIVAAAAIAALGLVWLLRRRLIPRRLRRSGGAAT
jgi:energy-coupling factor transport system substrate-specific component